MSKLLTTTEPYDADPSLIVGFRYSDQIRIYGLRYSDSYIGFAYLDGDAECHKSMPAADDNAGAQQGGAMARRDLATMPWRIMRLEGLEAGVGRRSRRRRSGEERDAKFIPSSAAGAADHSLGVTDHRRDREERSFPGGRTTTGTSHSAALLDQYS